MYDVILFHPRIDDNNIISPPLGLLFLASVLEQHSYCVKVIDENLENFNMNDLLTNVPLFVGISSMSGPQLLGALRIAREVRERNPDVPIVWGGPHASLMPVQTVSHSLADIAVEGEGEETVVDLAEAMRNNKDLGDVAGIYFKDKSGQVHYTGPRELLDFNTAPFPAWSHIEHNLESYMKYRDGRLMVQFSRGCPYRCSFCYNKQFNRQKFRGKSPDRIIEELEYLIKKYDIRKFDICDDNFITYKNDFLNFAEGIKDKNLDVDLQLSVRLNYIDSKVIDGLKTSKVSKVFIGIESGSQRILDEITKDIKIEKIKHAATLLSESHIIGFYSFMFNFPFETKEDLIKTKELAEFIYNKDKKSIINLNSYCPYPGTKLYERAIKEYGFKEPSTLEEWGVITWHKPLKLFTSNFSSDFSEAFILLWRFHFSKNNSGQGLIRKRIKKWADLFFEQNLLTVPAEMRLILWLNGFFRPFLKKLRAFVK